jgi:glyoxylase-like metal-dependent hydrolase (beta-lactamase superfamily II)
VDSNGLPLGFDAGIGHGAPAGKVEEEWKVIKGVYRVAGADLTDARDCNVFLLDAEEPALIDSGFGAAVDKMIKNIEACAVDPSRISTVILTHCHIDHIGGAAQLRKQLGARLYMHHLDAEITERGDNRLTAAFCFDVLFHPLTIDVKIIGAEGHVPADGRDISFLHTPGHTPGSISLYVDADGKRVLFGQDLGAPLLGDFDCDSTAWRLSMEKLLALKADVLCDGHSGIYEPARTVAAYIRHFMKLYAEDAPSGD